MSADSISAPVELAVLEFPGSQFNGEIIPALAALVDDRVVTILDLILVTKDVAGSVTAVEINEMDAPIAAMFDELDGEVNGLLSEDDLAIAAETLSLGSSALLIVWENTWARRLLDAVAASGGRLVAHDRLDAETVTAALADATAG